MNIESQIRELTDKDTFWSDVKEILGDTFFEDWQIKRLQVVAEKRYEEIEGETK